MEKKAEAEMNGSSSDVEVTSKKSKIYYPRSLTLQVIDWYNVYVQVYVPVILYAIVCLLTAKIAHDMAGWQLNLSEVAHQLYTKVVSNVVAVTDAFLGVLIIVIIVLYIRSQRNSVYLIDFATFKPPAEWRVGAASSIHLSLLP